jgi:zinc transport system ATP-binding protein
MSIDHSRNIVEVRNVFFQHEHQDVLKDITLNIHQGDYLAIVGPNGAGKTTLLKIILGLLRPSQGSANIFGHDASSFKDRWKIGYVPQKATHIDARFPATVWEVVAMGLYRAGQFFYLRSDSDASAIARAIEHVGMMQYRRRLIGDLSVGQQQRVFIARALVSCPEIIFLDEPTVGVDADSQDAFYALLKKMNHDLGVTLVLITHDVRRALKEAMHIACIDHRLVCHSSPAEYLKDNPSLEIGDYTVKAMEHYHQ